MGYDFLVYRKKVVLALVFIVGFTFFLGLASGIDSTEDGNLSVQSTSSLEDTSNFSIKTLLNLDYYSVISLERKPIVFGNPVEWIMTISDGLYTYLINFETPAIFLTENETLDNVSWNKSVFLSTNYSGVYKNISFNVSLPSNNFVVMPKVNFTILGNYADFVLAELNRTKQINLYGSFLNESINLSKLNISSDEELYNASEILSGKDNLTQISSKENLSNAFFKTDKSEYLVNDTVAFSLPQNISGYSIYVDTPSGKTIYVENNSFVVNESGRYFATLIFNDSIYNWSFNVLSSLQESIEFSTRSAVASYGVFNITSSKGTIEQFIVDDELNIRFRISNLTLGESIAVNISLPMQIPKGVYFYVWKESNNKQIKVPFNISESRDKITLFLKDGSIDDDGLINGIIEDPLKLFIPKYPVKVEFVNKREAKVEVSKRNVKLLSKEGELASVNVVDPENLPNTPVNPKDFKHKLLKFKITNLTGDSTDIVLNFDSLPEKFKLWKFNPNTLEWYMFPYQRLNSTAIQITIVDGGFGDDDGVKNGVIEDDLGITYQWWNESWLWRRAYNISNTAGDLTDYQFKLTLGSSNFNFSKAKSDGSDLRFTYYNESSDSEIEMSYWIEYYNSSSQQASIWVKVPFLKNNANTTIFVYYGNSDAVSESNKSAVFIRVIDGLVLSWNLDEGQGTTANDVSGNGNSGTIYGASWSTNCKFGSCLYFSGGTTDYIIKNPFNHPTQNVTIEFWMNSSDTANSGTPYSYATSSSDNEFLIYDYTSFRIYRATNYRSTGIAVNDGSWHHIAVTWTSNGGNVYLFEDGSQVYSNTLASGTTISTGGSLVIAQEQDSVGDNFAADQSFIGYMDEIRVYNRTLSLSEVQDLHNNYGYTSQYAPGEVLVAKYATPQPQLAQDIGEEFIGVLNITADKPAQNSQLLRNQQFTMNSTVVCERGSCGETSVYYQYYSTVSPTYTFLDSTNSDFGSYSLSENITTANDTLILSQVGSEIPWWDYHWRYRFYINFSNTAGQLIDYPIRIVLNSSIVGSNFNWTTDSESMRFLKYDWQGKNYTKLDYWIEYYNSSAQEAIVWVKVPLIENGTNTSIFVYYGNPNAVNESNISNMFIRVIDGLVLSWNLDEGQGGTVNDTSGKGNTGTIYGASWSTNCKFGSCLYFSGGTTDYIIKNPFNHPTENVTVEFWMNTSDTANSGTPYSYATSSNSNEFLIFDYTGFTIYRAANSRQTGVSANDGSWHHIVTTWTGTNGAISLYKDGSQAYTNTLASGTTIPSGGSLVIAQEQDSVGGTFDAAQSFIGYMDEIRVYNRTLSLSEVQDLHNNYGYTTPYLPGKVLVKKYANPEPKQQSNSLEESYDQNMQGTYISPPFDAGTSEVDYVNITWDYYTNANTTLKVYTRTSTGQSTEWWNPEWLYRQEINISNSGSPITNYTLRLSINTSKLFNENKLRNDCGDIRFAEKNNQWSEISYYIESCNVSGGNSTIWVNIPNLSTGTNTIYMYYGNPSARTTSSLNALPHIEFGIVTLSDSIDGSVVQTINLAYNYTNPVVVAYVITRNDDESVDVRVRNVQHSSFEIFMEEPDDGTHASETVAWIVTEAGSFTDLNDVLRIESGKHRTDTVHSEGNAFAGDSITFSNSFSSTPVVVATLNTYNNSDFMSTISYNPTATGFSLEQEAGGSGSAVYNETIGWIAFSQGSGAIDGISYNIAAIASDGDNDGVDNSDPEFASYSFAGNPVIVVDGTTENGVDGYWARGAGTYTNTQASFYAEEDQIGDTERSHTSEGFNWVAFYPEGNLTLKTYTATNPTATFGQELDYGSVSQDSSNLIWTPWYLEANGQEPNSPDYRFIQYKVEFTTTNENQTPKLNSISIDYEVLSAGWKDMALSGTLFRTESPYVCGVLNQSNKYCYPDRQVTPIQTGEFLLRSCAKSITYPEIDVICTKSINVSVWLKLQLTEFTISKDPVGKGENVTIRARLLSDDGVTPLVGYNLTFVDLTGNGTSSYNIGSVLTDGNGYGTIIYQIPNDAYLGTHIINVSYAGSVKDYILPVSQTKSVLVSSTPKINSINITPDKVGFGYNITIDANVTDEKGLAKVYINITNSSGSSSLYEMQNTGGDIFRYIFTDTWHADDYTFRIIANNTDGVQTTSEEKSFSVEVFANISVKTLLDNYKNRELVFMKNYTTESWFNNSWDYRTPIKIKSNTQPLYEYQVYLDKDLSGYFSDGKILADCSDIRFTYYNESSKTEVEIPYFIDYCNLSQSSNAQIWVKVPYISNTTDTTIYMYYGNSNANDNSNLSATFSYAQPRLIGYLVSQNTVTNGLQVVSLEDGNTIVVGSNQYSLDSLGTFSLSTGLSLNTPLKVTKLTNFEGDDDVDDMIVPISWAGTEFIYGGMRDGNDEFCMLAPFGDASVTIYDGGVSEWSGTVTSSGTCVQNDITSGNAARIVSDKPILVFREGTANNRDAWAFYPATTDDLYLPSVSTDGYVATGVFGATAYYYTSSGSSGSASISSDSEVELSGQTGTGNDGSGPAIKISASYPVGLIQQADSDGSESTVAVPLKEMSTVFGSSLDAEYIAIVTPFKGTNCSVYDTNGLVGSTTVSGSDTTKVYKACFNCGTDNVIYVNGPWKLACDKPVWAYYEEATDDDETNMLGYKQMRQYTWPEPTVNFGKEETGKTGVYNLGDTNFKGQLRMLVQKWTGSSWQNIIPPVFDSTLYSITNKSIFDIATLWNNNPWNTSDNDPGRYRMYIVFEDPDHNILVDSLGNKLEAWYEFTIVNATIVLTNVTYENKYDYSIEEYETGDKIDWVNVTVKPVNNSAYNVNVTLNLLDHLLQPVNWGPNETKYCGFLAENEECEQQWNNLSYGYPIPLDASSGSYNIYWNIKMDTSNGNEQTNRTYSFILHNIPSTFTKSVDKTRLYKPDWTYYNFTFTNSWSKNLTNVKVKINCDDVPGLTCTCIASGTDVCDLGEIANNTQVTVAFNVSVNESVPSANYNVNITLNYTNPGNEQKSWKEYANQILEVRSLGILEIHPVTYPLNVTRNYNAIFETYINNTGDTVANDVWLNYSLPAGWSVSSGSLDKYQATLDNGSIMWNNITVSIGQSVNLGTNVVQIYSGASDGRDDWKTLYVDVYANTTLVLTVNQSLANKGDTVRLQATLKYDNGTAIAGENITFYDQTNNTFIGWNITNAQGIAYVYYTIPQSASLGYHILNASFDGDDSIYALPSKNTTTLDVHIRPSISNINVNPSVTGYGKIVKINATVSDDDSVDKVLLKVTYPNGTTFNYQMNLIPIDTYYYDFNDTWQLGVYNFTIWANDTTSSYSESQLFNFTVNVSSKVLVQTVNRTYKTNSYVNLTEQNTLSWLLDNWTKRVKVRIENTNKDLYEYQIYVVKNLSQEYQNGNIKPDCSDIRVTYYNSSTKDEFEIPYFIDHCDLTSYDNVSLWIKVPYIENNTNTTVYIYFGNPDASDNSNISATFSYSQPRLIGYLVSQNIVANGLRIVSLEDGNTVVVGSNQYSLDSLDTLSLSTDLALNTSVNVTKLASFEGNGDIDDMIVPISWAGTEFVYGGMRDTGDRFCMLAPFGDASVTIYDGGTPEWSNTVTSSGICVQNDITNGNAARIVSDKPILVFREGSGNSQDAWAFYPATTDNLYLPSVSNDGYVATGSSGVTAYYYASSSSSGSASISSDSEVELSGSTGNGNDGSGPAIKVYANNPVGLIQQADSDGTESSVAVPLKEMSTVFGSSLDAEYIAIVTPFKGTNCSVYDVNGLVGSTTVSGSDTTKVYKACFNCGTDDVVYVNGPWKLACDKPVWAYYEEATDDDETNMLGYKQMRQYTWPEPTVNIEQTEDKPSQVLNTGQTEFNAYVVMKVQYNNSGSWQDVSVVVDDLSNGIVRTVNSSGLDLGSIWNNVSWNTQNNKAGTYRVYAGLFSKDGILLKNYDGSNLEAYSIFQIEQPPLQVNITDIRVYDVSSTSEANWRIYTKNLVDSGLNKTFDLYKDHVYRIEIDAKNIGQTVWNISTTTVSYYNLNPLWIVNQTYIWYSNETLVGDRRLDSNFVGGLFDGNVSWNTSLDGLVTAGNSATFFVIVNITSIGDEQVDFNMEHTDFMEDDFSLWHIIELDTVPPKLYNDIYNLTNNSIFRGDSTIAYARWDETIAQANVTYTTTSSSTWVVQTNTSPQNTYNWTNFTISTSSTWFLGEHQIKISAKDESGNWNDTLPYVNLTIWGKAQVTDGSLNDSTIDLGQSVRIACKVTDATDSNNPVSNYVVYFYNSTDLIGTNVTDDLGWAYYVYTDNSPGQETLKCNISENLTRYYKIDSLNYKSFTLTTQELVPPYYTTISGPSLVHKGDNVKLSVLWHDNYALSNATLVVNTTGTWQNETTIALTGLDDWANFSYQIPTTMNPGFMQWKQDASDAFGNLNNTMPAQNIEVWGWSSIANEYVSPASIQETNSTTMHCKVIDSNSSSAIQGMVVNFWIKNSTSSTYNYLGSNLSDSSGWANYTFVVNVADSYVVMCNITDNATLRYNASSDNFGTANLNVVVGEDVTPPRIVGNNYTINDTEITRGECIYVSGLWDESINQSWVTYDMVVGSFNDYELTPPFVGNWTNVSICTNSSWQPGNHSVKLKAKDQNGNLNDTLPYKNFTMWGRAKLEWISPVGNVDRGNITLICRVTDYDTLQGIENYKVTFYDGDLGYSIGYNYTNSSGYAMFTYDFSNHYVGPDQLSCSITDDNDKFYKVQGSTIIYQTINLYGYLFLTITSPGDNSIIHIGDAQSLNSTVVDEFGNSPKDDLGNPATITAYWYNSSSNQIASGQNTIWNIPTTYDLGIETLTLNESTQYYHNGSDSVNVFVYSFANVTWIKPEAGSYQDVTLNLTCLVQDTIRSQPVANYPVEFFDGLTSLGVVNTNSSGYAVKQITTSSLGDGAHDLKCVIYDNDTLYYNKTSPYEDGVSIIVDNVPPVIYYNPNSDVSGNYSRNWILVNITASDSNKDTVLLYWNNTAESFANNQGDIYWTNKTGLSDGTYTLYAFVNDTAGNTNQTVVRTVRIDTTAPVLTIISPLDKAYSSNQIWFNISANEELNSCVFSIDSGVNNSMNKYNGTYYYNLSLVSDGYHNVTFYCNDTVNNTGTAFTNFTVDTTAPSVVLNYPNDYSNESSSIINFSCTASDSFALVNVSLYANFSGTWQRVLTNSSPVNNTPTIFQRTLSDGVYSWNCEACDGAQCSFAPLNYTLIVDTTKPIILIQSPQNKSYNQTTLTLNYTVNEIHLDECWYNNGTVNISLPNCQNITLSSLTEGSHSIIVYANDTAGNVGNASVNYTIDLVKPQISIQSPLDSEEYQDSNSLDLNYTVSDDKEISSCWYVLDANSPVNLPGCTNTTLVGLTNADHNLTVYVNDTAGNMNYSSITFKVNLTELVVTAISPENNSYYNTSWVWLNATTNKDAVSCNFSIDGNANQSLNSLDPQHWYYNYSGLSEGSHNVIFYCSDATNNISNSGYVYFTIDLINPNLSVDNPKDGEIYNTSNVNLNYTASDNYGLSCYYDLDNSGFVELVGCSNTTLSSLSEGMHNVVVKVIDLAQNLNVSSIGFYVDTIAPNITLISPQNINYTTNNIWINISSNENLSSCLFEFDANGLWYNMNKYNETYYYNLSFVSDGLHNVTVRCNDTAGNVGTNFTEFNVDTTGPVFTFVPPTPSDNGAVDVTWVYVNVTTNEPADVLTLTWVNSTGTSYYTMTKIDSTHFYYNVTNLIDGTYNYSVSGNDTLGNTASSPLRKVLVSTEAPIVYLTSPVAQTYNYSIIDLNASSNKFISEWWFELNGVNYSFEPNTTITADFGSNSLTVFARDSGGKVGNASVDFDTNLTTWADTFDGYTGISYAENLFTNQTIHEARNAFCWPAVSQDYNNQTPDCWKYRRELNISAPSTLTDYQVRLSINLSLEKSQGKVGNDCRDLRFTYLNSSSEEEPINFWVEDCGTGSENSTIWIKVPSIETTGSIVYLYYGNPNAKPGDNANAVFEFFDDFNTVSSSVWGANADNWYSQSGYAVPNATGSSSQINAVYTLPNTYQTILKLSADAGGIAGYYRFGNGLGTKNLRLYFDPANNRVDLYNGASNYYSLNISQQTRFRIISDFVSDNYELYVNNNQSAAISLSSASAGSNINPLFYAYYVDSMYIDWIAISKYSSNGPLLNSIGSEEKPLRNATVKSILLSKQSTSSWDTFDVNGTLDGSSNMIFRILDSSNNSLCGDISFASVVNGYQVCSAAQSETSIYLQAILIPDASHNTPHLGDWSINLSKNLADLTISNISFSSENFVEGQDYNITVNVTNLANIPVSNVVVRLNISFWDGSKTPKQSNDSVTFDLGAYESKLINFTWTAEAGTHIFEAYADPDNLIAEVNESNNYLGVNKTTPAWAILYGNYSYEYLLQDESNSSIKNWTPSIPVGNLYFSDVDSSYSIFDLEPLNGTNDLAEADQALNLVGFSDSIKKLFDKDNDDIPDNLGTFELGSRVLTNVPYINSTNNSYFITALLWDSNDGGTEYNGSQDLVVFTVVNASKQGRYGVYDYEVRIPYTLKSYKGSIDKILRIGEFI